MLTGSPAIQDQPHMVVGSCSCAGLLGAAPLADASSLMPALSVVQMMLIALGGRVFGDADVLVPKSGEHLQGKGEGKLPLVDAVDQNLGLDVHPICFQTQRKVFVADVQVLSNVLDDLLGLLLVIGVGIHGDLIFFCSP